MKNSELTADQQHRKEIVKGKLFSQRVAEDRGFCKGSTINFSDLIRLLYEGKHYYANGLSCNEIYFTMKGHIIFPAIISHIKPAGFVEESFYDSERAFEFDSMGAHYKKYNSENKILELYLWKADYQTIQTDIYLSDKLPF